MTDYRPPYHFVPVRDGQRDSTASHVGHDVPLAEPELLSGSIQCTLHALTPLFVGNEREGKEGEHMKVYPLKVGAAETALLSKHSLRGLVAHVHAAMTAARMDRIEEGRFLFRPMLYVARDAQYPYGMGILESVDGDKALVRRIEAYQEERRVVYFRSKEDAKAQAELDEAEYGCVGLGADHSGILHRAHVKSVEESGGPRQGSADYAQSDERWIAFKRAPEPTPPPRHVAARPQAPSGPPSTFRITKPTLKRFADTTELLRARADAHPTLSKHLKKIPKSERLASLVLAGRELKEGTLIFFEYVRGQGVVPEITTFGTSFRYPWLYRDTIRSKNGKPRNELGLSAREADWFSCQEGGALHAHRRLFGTVLRDEWAPKRAQVARRGYRGRVSFSHGLFQGGGVAAEPMVLKALASPKASSWEFYLRQGSGGAKTWGSDPCSGDDSGDLSGRKFYLHHRSVQMQDYAADGERPDNATVHDLRLPAANGDRFPRYRFTVHFRGIEKRELGGLIRAIDLANGLWLKTDVDVASEIARRIDHHGEALHAHKLGAGRPLGLGSAVISIDRLRIVELAPPSEADFGLPRMRDSTADDMEGWARAFDGGKLWDDSAHRTALERITRFEDPPEGVRLGYPGYDVKEGTLKFHAAAKLHHWKERRTGRRPKADMMTLRPADGPDSLPAIRWPPPTPPPGGGGGGRPHRGQRR